MLFGKDFFKIVQFVVWFLRGWARMFGDDEDRQADDEVKSNHMAHMPDDPDRC